MGRDVLDWSDSGKGAVENSGENGNEKSGSIKYWEILQYMWKYQILHKASAPRSGERAKPGLHSQRRIVTDDCFEPVLLQWRARNMQLWERKQKTEGSHITWDNPHRHGGDNVLVFDTCLFQSAFYSAASGRYEWMWLRKCKRWTSLNKNVSKFWVC
jgi:hypothetical protein